MSAKVFDDAGRVLLRTRVKLGEGVDDERFIYRLPNKVIHRCTRCKVHRHETLSFLLESMGEKLKLVSSQVYHFNLNHSQAFSVFNGDIHTVNAKVA